MDSIMIPGVDAVAFYDSETSGLDDARNEILSMALVVAVITEQGLQRVASWTSLVRPERPETATPEALAVNGLNLDDLATAPTLAEALAEAADVLTPFGRVVFAGHNLAFDLRFLELAEERAGIRLPRHPALTIDTMAMAKAHLVSTKVLKSSSLVTVAAHYRLAYVPHIALNDCVACLEVAQRIAEEAPDLFRAHTVQAMQVSNQLEVLALLRAQQAEVRAQATATPEYQALLDAQAAYNALPIHEGINAEVASLQQEYNQVEHGLQELLADGAGMVGTGAGGQAGYKVDRSYTYSVADVRRLLPDYADDIIEKSEHVVYGKMQAAIKAAVALNQAPKDVMDQIKAGATVEEKKTWRCAPGKLADRDAATARLVAIRAAMAAAPSPAVDDLVDAVPF